MLTVIRMDEIFSIPIVEATKRSFHNEEVLWSPVDLHEDVIHGALVVRKHMNQGLSYKVDIIKLLYLSISRISLDFKAPI